MTTHSAEVVFLHPGATWDAVREAYGRMQQMGWQSVLQAARVGAMLIELKRETPHGEFMANWTRVSNSTEYKTCQRMMRLAANLPMLEQHRPDSQRAAIALIKEANPKKKRSGSTSAIAVPTSPASWTSSRWPSGPRRD